jgi:hypothetical protein
LFAALAAVLGALLVPVLVIGMVVLVIMAFVLGARRERERREAMRAYAARMGMRFTEEDASLDERMAAFPPFQLGHSRRGLNLMQGDAVLGGVRMTVVAGDYQYKVTTSNGKSTQTVTYNMSFISVAPTLSIGEDLTVREEGVLDKIGAFLGFDDIDFESSEFFDPRMMEYFLQSRPPRLHARGGVLLFDRGTRRWDVAEFEAMRGWIDGFFARVPRHVRAARLPSAEQAADPVLNPGLQGGHP